MHFALHKNLILFIFALASSSSLMSECEIAEIPACVIGTQRMLLDDARTILVQRRDTLKDKVARHNSRCGPAVRSQRDKADCDNAQRQLENEIKQYCSAAQQFNSEVMTAKTACQVPNLALNPKLAAVYLIELSAVRARMARLRKVLDILKKSDEEAAKEWEILHEETVQQGNEIDWQAFLFATAGLGQFATVVSADEIRNAQAIQRKAIWTEVPIERAKLQQLMALVDERNRAILREVIGAIDRIEVAHRREDNIESLNRMLEAAKALQERMTHLNEPGIDPKTVNVFYEFSVLMGRMAISFGTGIVERSSVAASLLEPLTEAGAIYVMIIEEDRQFTRLRSQFADRQRVRREVNEKLSELENRQQLLVTEIGRMDPSAKVGPKL